MSKHVLIVDDNPFNIKIFRAKLEHEGFKVSSTVNGRDSLLFLQTTIPDVIILDLMMPGIDGLSFLKLARNRPELKKTPIVVFSAKDQPEDQLRAYELGANGYLVKTKATPNDVLAKINEVMNENGVPDAAPILPSHFHMQIRDNTLDALKMTVKLGLTPDFRCKPCNAKVVLTLTEGMVEGVKTFLAKFCCPKCQAGNVDAKTAQKLNNFTQNHAMVSA